MGLSLVQNHGRSLFTLCMAASTALLLAAVYTVSKQKRSRRTRAVDDLDRVPPSATKSKKAKKDKSELGDQKGVTADDDAGCAQVDPHPVRAKSGSQQPKKDKGAARLEWWQRLNEVKPALFVPALPACHSQETSQVVGATMLAVSKRLPDAEKVHQEVTRVVNDRLKRGKDWLVRDSDYVVQEGVLPAHAAVKAKVNAALVKVTLDVFGDSLQGSLASDPRNIVLLLDTPQYGTLRNLVATWPQLQCCQQVIVPQADLRHYFEMTRAAEFYPGVRAQRLDHWLCANATLGLRSLVSFLDYECRLVGAMSARLCPAADIMRYFRCGYPAQPVSVLALTVGLEDPAPTPETVDAFVQWEAALNGYTVELKDVWKYRMVTLLYVVRHAAPSAISG